MKIFLIGFSSGYIISMLLFYLIFGKFSWSFATGSLMGILLFGFILYTIRKKKKQGPV